MAASLFLQGIVAYGAGGVERAFKIARLQPLILALGVMGPHARIAVGLQFLAHRQAVSALGALAALARCGGTLQHALPVLHTVAHLVGNDIGARQIALGAKAGGHFLKEAQVKVGMLIAGAVKRAHGAAAGAAGRAQRAGVEHQPGFTIGLPLLAEKRLPDILGAGHEDRKSTRLNSSHVAISYAVFCLKKKKTT